VVTELASNSPDPEPSGGMPAGAAPASPSEAPRRARVIRYGAMGYVGEFSCKPGLAFGCGARVVVQTERGIELGEPVGVPCIGCGCDLTVPQPQLLAYIRSSGAEFCRPRAGRILRIASEQDAKEHSRLNAHLREDVDHCAALAFGLGLDVKIVTAEHLLGGERIVFYFSAPTRVDFRQLVKELAQRYRTRIEMRQVGARDEARLVADYEVCGRECCCKNFLKKLRPVNMKMAKLQKSTLDPSKVSGRCGRLRCCLRYEHYGYEELARRLPRVGSRVGTELGEGTVQDRQVLTQLVLVRTDDDRTFTIPVEEIKAFDLPPPPRPEPPPAPAGAPAAPPDAVEKPRGGRQRSRSQRMLRGGPERAAGLDAPAPTAEESRFVEEPASAATEPAPPAEDAAKPVQPDGAGAPDVTAGAPASAAADAPTQRRRRRRRRGRRGEPTPPPGEDTSST
jgi:cell fate regulator YaaT (PSP1 superfamily)